MLLFSESWQIQLSKRLIYLQIASLLLQVSRLASGTTVHTGITAKFTKGTDTFSSTDCAQDGQKDLVMDCGSFTIATTLSKGNYTLTLAHATDKNTITATPAPLCYTSECPPALVATQAKTASIAYEGDTAGNFTISFAAAFTTKPTINAGTVALTWTEVTHSYYWRMLITYWNCT